MSNYIPPTQLEIEFNKETSNTHKAYSDCIYLMRKSAKQNPTDENIINLIFHARCFALYCKKLTNRILEESNEIILS